MAGEEARKRAEMEAGDVRLSLMDSDQRASGYRFSIAEIMARQIASAEESNTRHLKLKELGKLLEKHKDVMRILELSRELGIF
jgi:hypothetical protein